MMTAGLDTVNRFLIVKNSMTVDGCVYPKLLERAVEKG